MGACAAQQWPPSTGVPELGPIEHRTRREDLSVRSAPGGGSVRRWNCDPILDWEIAPAACAWSMGVVEVNTFGRRAQDVRSRDRSDEVASQTEVSLEEVFHAPRAATTAAPAGGAIPARDRRAYSCAVTRRCFETGGHRPRIAVRKPRGSARLHWGKLVKCTSVRCCAKALPTRDGRRRDRSRHGNDAPGRELARAVARRGSSRWVESHQSPRLAAGRSHRAIL